MDAERAADRRLEPRHHQPAEGTGEFGQTPTRVGACNPGREHRTRLEPAGMGIKLGAAHNLLHRADGADPAVGDQHDRAGEPGYFGNRVADINDRHIRLIAQPLEIGQDLVLARRVERGQRLVHQQQARARQQGPADRHPLFFAARETARPTVEQRTDPEQIDNLGEPAAGRRAGREPMPEHQVPAHRQVRKEAVFLKDIAYPAPVRRQLDAVFGVEQHRPIDGDAAVLRPDQPGNRLDDRGLAGARPAEQRGQAVPAGEMDVEGKAAEPMREIDFEHRRQSPATRRPSRCASISEASRASIDSATATRVRRSAAGSPPGTWVRV